MTEGDGPRLPCLSDPEVSALSRTFGLLAEPTRVRLVLLLCCGELTAGAVAARLGLPPPTVSYHLGLMRMGGLLSVRRAGKNRYYVLDRRFHAGDQCELRIGSAPGLTVQVQRDRTSVP